jgi:hypothetical protein
MHSKKTAEVYQGIKEGISHPHPALKSLCPLTGGFDKTTISCDFFFLTYNSLFFKLNAFQSEFLSKTFIRRDLCASMSTREKGLREGISSRVPQPEP